MLNEIQKPLEISLMAATFQIPLDIPDVELLSTEIDKQGALLNKVIFITLKQKYKNSA